VTLASLSTINALLHHPTPGLFDDYFDDASLSSTWSAILPTGANTLTEANDIRGVGRLSVLYSGQAASDLAGIVKPISGLAIGDYIQAGFRNFGYDANYQMAALVFSDGNTAASNKVAVYFQGQGGSQNVLVTRGGTFDTVGADIQSATANAINNANRLDELHVRFTWQASNSFRVQVSPDGISWIQRLSDTARTITPTHAGLGWTMWGGANNSITSFSYFITNA
jgi:hypothetical protein